MSLRLRWIPVGTEMLEQVLEGLLLRQEKRW